MDDVAGFTELLAGKLPGLYERTVEEFERDHPAAYALLGADLAGSAVRAANQRMLIGLDGDDMAAASRAMVPLAAEIGSLAGRAAAPLEELSAAVRVYHRLSWDAAAEAATELELPARTVTDLAAAYIRFADDFTRAMAEGYAAAVADSDRAREALLRDLLDGPCPAAELRRRASACAWDVPELVRVAVTAGPAPTWPPGALHGRWQGHAVAVLDGTRLDAPAAYGPPVPPEDAATSLRIALRLPQPGPVLWEDNLTRLAVSGDPISARALADRALAPLDQASERQRAWLRDTLRAWLDDPGSPSRISRALHLHPQSTRYRLRRLRDVFGDALDDPDHRFTLRLALEIRAA